MRYFSLLSAALSGTALLLAGQLVAADVPAAPAPAQLSGEYLNNVVRSLKVTNHFADGKLSAYFEITDAGWVWLEFSAPVQDVKLFCNGRPAADASALVDHREFMLDLPTGKYALAATPMNGTDGEKLTVARLHRIPEIYYYTPHHSLPLDGTDVWKDIGPQLLTSTNLIAPGDLTAEQLATYRKAGRKVFFNVMASCLWEKGVDAYNAQMQERILQPEWDGCTVDEFGFRNTHEYKEYRTAFEKINNPDNKRIYTWAYNVSYDGIPEELQFSQLCANPPHARGRLMTEVYLETKETEKEAEEFVYKRVIKDAASILSQIPGFAQHYGIVPGNFNSMPILTQESVPEADYKYYLDRQLYWIANDPVCKDLGLVGYWGGNYCQDELQRWCLALLRHYFVYGNREMYSAKFGYKYLPGILTNGDFIADLDGWEAIPAEKDSIRHDAVKDHGYLMQCRWGTAPSAKGGVHNGDDAAVMVKSAQGANVLRQLMKNLTPGKPYQLQFVVGSFDDAKNKVNKPREYGIRAVIDPADAGIRSSGIYVDNRVNHRYSGDAGFSRANVHRIVFVPNKPEVMLTLTDADSPEPVGTQLQINFVQVKPYFAPEMLER